MLTTELKTQILQLLHEHKTEQALALCEGLGEAYRLLQSQLNKARNHEKANLLAAEYFEATKSRINDALQELIAQTPEHTGQKPGFWASIRRYFTATRKT